MSFVPPPIRAHTNPDTTTSALNATVRRALVAALALAVIATSCASTDDDPAVSPTTTTQTTLSESTDLETTDVESTTEPRPREVIDYALQVTETLPHDPNAYTQGLEVVDGLLVESTGLRGESSIRVVDPTTGQPIRATSLDDELFGEGATVVGDEIWQLTWTSETLLIHGLDDLTERRRLRYGGEGWGLCATADRLVMSDGSSALTFRDPTTFDPVGQVQVTDDGEPLGRLNELECVDGVVWANVYQTTMLVAIDPADGRVVGRADMAELVPDGFAGDSSNVANGIAHDPTTGRFYLTGKRWPVLYEVELVPVS